MDSGPSLDSGRRDGGSGMRDAGARDAFVPRDAGPLCGGMTCMAFQYCDNDRCRDYDACAGDGTCPRTGDVCRNRRCVPGTVDIDGDGTPARDDCDETNPEIFPTHPEVCNTIDDNCSGSADEGDPATLCESDPVGGVCMDGVCGCPDGTADIDRAVPGCECNIAPAPGEGATCDAPVDVGDLTDTGEMRAVSGNLVPAGREVWYRVRAVDSPDTACDNFYFRAQFLVNPADEYELMVFRGDCATAPCADATYTDFSWATDFRRMGTDRLEGQCPCFAPGAVPTTDVSVCEDDTAVYLLRVRRRAAATLTCESFTIELSNGAYDS